MERSEHQITAHCYGAMVARMKDQIRNLNPHKSAKAAMWLYGKQYAASGGGSMDFWDSLSDSAKRRCRDLVADIEKCPDENAVP